MIKRIKQRNNKRLKKVFAEGRTYFPKKDFPNIKLMGFMPRYKLYHQVGYKLIVETIKGHPVFTTPTATQFGRFVIEDEAAWRPED